MVTELRFPSPGWKFYVQGGLLGLFGIVLMVLGVIIVAVDPWNFLGAVSMAGGIVFAVEAEAGRPPRAVLVVTPTDPGLLNPRRAVPSPGLA